MLINHHSNISTLKRYITNPRLKLTRTRGTKSGNYLLLIFLFDRIFSLGVVKLKVYNKVWSHIFPAIKEV